MGNTNSMITEIDEQPLIGKLSETVRGANADVSSLQRAAKILAGNPAEVLQVLAVYAQRAKWRGFASQPYWHPNGFAKFVVYDDARVPLRLRLHVWAGEDSRVLQDGQNVHGHRWNFGSAVIAGSGLRIDEYVLNDREGQPYRSFAYQPQRQGGTADAVSLVTSSLEPVGDVLVEHAVRYALAIHDTYVCDITRLHTVHSLSTNLVATLIVQGPAVLSTAPVYRRSGLPPQPGPRAMSSTETHEVLAATIDAARIAEFQR